jgi:hypothetical protein
MFVLFRKSIYLVTTKKGITQASIIRKFNH